MSISNSHHPVMQTLFSPFSEPDLSLNISPPSISEAKESVGCKALYNNDMCSLSTSDSAGSSESELSHENNGFNNLCPPREPTLRLGYGAVDLNPHYSVQGGGLRNFNHHHHHLQPRGHPVYGREFKRNARVVNGGKRSVRAPRMRWTTTLHAHFVHAVQLLGGHESKLMI